MISDIYPGNTESAPNNLCVERGRLFFYADDGTHGSELWTLDIWGNLNHFVFLPGIMR
jgi:hypothetical protein